MALNLELRTTGKIEEIFCSNRWAGFHWTMTLSEFLMNSYISSAIFEAMDNTWFLRLYRECREGKQGRVGLELYRDRPLQSAVNFLIAIEPGGMKQRTVVSNQKFPVNSHSCYASTDLNLSMLLKGRVQQSNLIVICKLWKEEKSSDIGMTPLTPQSAINPSTKSRPAIRRNATEEGSRSNVNTGSVGRRALLLKSAIDKSTKSRPAIRRNTAEEDSRSNVNIGSVGITPLSPQSSNNPSTVSRPAIRRNTNEGGSCSNMNIGSVGVVVALPQSLINPSTESRPAIRRNTNEGCSRSNWNVGSVEKEFVSRETQTDVQSNSPDREESLHTKVDPTLQKHLKDLLLTSHSHDVTIKIRNKKFRAHKCILEARSTVFAAMFKHDMKENADGSVSIDDCDPEAFGDFLSYVYTGKVENLTPGKATALYYTGEKYDVLGLKEVCLQFLESSLSKISVCDVIDLAKRHGENGLLESAINFFSENVKEILPTVEWQRFASNNFVLANELFMRTIKSFDDKKKLNT